MKINWMDEHSDTKDHSFGLHAEYEKSDGFLNCCPFCMGHNLEIRNTHSPCFSVSCIDCGAEGPTSYGDSSLTGEQIRGMSREEYQVVFEVAFRQAIFLWNDR